MSASRFPWDVLGVTPAATEKEVRRAYATRLKQLDTAKNPEQFQELRRAYEAALMRRRVLDAEPEIDEAETEPDEPEQHAEGDFQDASPNTARPPDLTAPFKAMQALVEKRDYSVASWQQLLNNPLLDAPEASAAFEYAVVSALSENELKTEFTLSASKGWRDLIESRYAWVSDGIRYTRRFPFHADLRQALVELGRSSRPIPYSSVPERNQFAGLGTVGLVLFVLFMLIQIFNRAAQSGVTP